MQKVLQTAFLLLTQPACAAPQDRLNADIEHKTQLKQQVEQQLQQDMQRFKDMEREAAALISKARHANSKLMVSTQQPQCTAWREGGVGQWDRYHRLHPDLYCMYSALCDTHIHRPRPHKQHCRKQEVSQPRYRRRS